MVSFFSTAVIDTIEKKFKIPTEKILKVKNINGSINVVGTNTNKVEMIMKKIIRYDRDENDLPFYYLLLIV